MIFVGLEASLVVSNIFEGIIERQLIIFLIKPNDQRIPCLCGEDAQYVIAVIIMVRSRDRAYEHNFHDVLTTS